MVCPKCGETEILERDGMSLCSHCNGELHLDSAEETALNQAFTYLEKGEYEQSEEFLENALTANDECAAAYIGKILAALKLKSINALYNLTVDFNRNVFWIKAKKYGSDYLTEKLTEIEQYLTINRISEKIKISKSISDYQKCISELMELNKCKKSDDLIEYCRNSIKQLENISDPEQNNTVSTQRKGKNPLIVAGVSVACIVAALIAGIALRDFSYQRNCKMKNEKLQGLMSNNQYYEAYNYIRENKKYIDSYEEKVEICIEELVASYIDREMFEEAEAMMEYLSSEQVKDNFAVYQKAVDYLSMEYYDSAAEHFGKISDFRDAKYMQEYALGWKYAKKEYDFYNAALKFQAAGTVRNSPALYESCIERLYEDYHYHLDDYTDDEYDDLCFYFEYLASLDYKDSKSIYQSLINNPPTNQSYNESTQSSNNSFQSNNGWDSISGIYYLYPSESSYQLFDTNSGEYLDEWVNGIYYMAGMIFNDATVSVSAEKSTKRLLIDINRYNSSTDYEEFLFQINDSESLYTTQDFKRTLTAGDYYIYFYEDGTLLIDYPKCQMKWVFGRDKNHG